MGNVKEESGSAKVEQDCKALADVDRKPAKEGEQEEVACQGKGPESHVRGVLDDVEKRLHRDQVWILVWVFVVLGGVEAVLGQVSETENPSHDKEEEEKEPDEGMTKHDIAATPSASQVDPGVEKTQDGKRQPGHGGERGNHTLRLDNPEPDTNQRMVGNSRSVKHRASGRSAGFIAAELAVAAGRREPMVPPDGDQAEDEEAGIVYVPRHGRRAGGAA